MWPFRRRQSNQSPIPSEVQDYYQAERRERVGVAWLLALATLVTTIVLAFGLFFGGRWTYRKVFNHNKSSVATNKPKSGQNTSASTSGNPTASSPPNPQSEGDTTVPQPSSSTSSSGQTTGSASSPLPNTGPGNTVAIFITTSSLAALAHNLFIRRRISSQKTD